MKRLGHIPCTTWATAAEKAKKAGFGHFWPIPQIGSSLFLRDLKSSEPYLGGIRADFWFEVWKYDFFCSKNIFPKKTFLHRFEGLSGPGSTLKKTFFLKNFFFDHKNRTSVPQIKISFWEAHLSMIWTFQIRKEWPWGDSWYLGILGQSWLVAAKFDLFGHFHPCGGLYGEKLHFRLSSGGCTAFQLPTTCIKVYIGWKYMTSATFPYSFHIPNHNTLWWMVCLTWIFRQKWPFSAISAWDGLRPKKGPKSRFFGRKWQNIAWKVYFMQKGSHGSFLLCKQGLLSDWDTRNQKLVEKNQKIDN